MAEVAAIQRWTPVAAAVVMAGVIGWPLARLAGVAIEDGLATVAATLTGRLVGVAIWNTVWTGALVAVLAACTGTAAALVTERLVVPARGWLRLGMFLPLVAPPFVGAFGWARAYGPRGLLDQVVGSDLPGLYGPVGVVLVLTVAATPVVWLIVAGALASRVEPDVERAARASGAGPLMTLWTVTLPLLRPALGSSAAVAFVFAVNAFGVPAVLGIPAGFATITTRIYQDLALSGEQAAFIRVTTLAVTLVVLAFAVVGSADALFTRRSATRTALPAGGGSHGPGGVAIALVMGAVIVVTTIVPFVAIALTALTRAIGLAPVPENWSLANFGQALDGRFVDGLVHSLILATAAASTVSLLGALLAALRGRATMLGTAVTLGFAIPGSALAVAVLLAYGRWLGDTLAIIFLAYVAKFWALGHRQLAGSIDRLPPDQLRAGRASGGGSFDVLRSIIIPLLRPSIVAGWLVVFVFALHELTMSSLLYGPTSATLAVVVLNAQQLGDPTVTAALAVLMTGLVLLAAAPLAVLGVGRRSRGPWAPAR
ncbi:MAG: iron ABC transporter permease [Candidatus Limnocylindrales bacterium]